MAEYVVVDKAKLNGDLETIGNAIRTQTEKTAKLHFPEELEREILSIVKAKPEQEKTVEITENGTVEVTPDLGKVLSKIIANVNVASGGGGKVATGSFISTSAESVLSIKHNLGVKPRFFIFWGEVENPTGSNDTSTMYRRGKKYKAEDMTSLYNGMNRNLTSAFGVIHNDKFYGCSSYFVYKDEPFNEGFFHYVLNETELVMNEGDYGIFPNNPSGLCTTYWVAIA